MEVPDEPAERERLLAGIDPERTAATAQHALLRQILRAEIAHWRATDGDNEHYENLYHSAFLLHLVGDVTDAPLLLEAKFVDFDTSIGFDWQFAVGAGIGPTLAHLRANGHADLAADLADYVDDDDLDRWRDFRRGYFYPGS